MGVTSPVTNVKDGLAVVKPPVSKETTPAERKTIRDRIKKLLGAALLGVIIAGSAHAAPNAPGTNCPIAQTNAYGCVKIGSGLSKDSSGSLYVTSTSSGGGSASLSALTSATTTNSINNAGFAQTWSWNSLAANTGLALSGTTTGSGTLFSATVTGASNTGYAGYFTNTATTGYALYVNGNCVGCSPVNALYYTTTSRTVASTDVNNLISYNSTSAGAWTVPVAGSAGFTAPNSAIYISDINSGALTLTATGGSVFNGLGGTTTAALSQNQWVFCVPDASNNYDCVGNTASVAGAGTVNSGTAKQVAYYASTGTAVSGSSVLSVTSTSVGIGTLTPGFALDIEGTASTAVAFQLGSSGAGVDKYAFATNGTGNGAAHNFNIYDGTANVTPLAVTTTDQTHVLVATVNAGVFGWAGAQFAGIVADTGLSRGGATVVDIGNGTPGSVQGAINTAFYLTGGTKFTATGCSNGTTVGGSSAGKFTVGANACTVTVTFGASGSSANGWACWANDLTAGLPIAQNGGSTTTATFSITSSSAASDVINFGCVGID